MRITRISFQGLLNQFDYSFDLREKIPICIIHGANGSGKTTILRMINALLKMKTDYLATVPFRSVKLEFEKDMFIEARVENYNRNVKDDFDIPPSKLIRLAAKLNGKPNNCTVPFFAKEKELYERLDHVRDRLMAARNHLTDLSGPTLDRMERERAFLSKRINELRLRRSSHPSADSEKNEIRYLEFVEWFKTATAHINTHFIGADRLHEFDDLGEEYQQRDDWRSERRSEFTTSTIYNCSSQIKAYIDSRRSDYAQFSQEIDRTFPLRLMERMKSMKTDSPEFIERELEQLSVKRKELVSAGLLDTTSDTRIMPDDVVDNYILRVLSLYIGDNKQKLAFFDDSWSRIASFLELTNRRFVRKRLEIDRKEGIICRLDDGQLLSLERLSSGEQHEIVMNYLLLFRAEQDSIILLDEPEISLHIAWQHDFLLDLEKALGITGAQCILATHSPDIINGRWEITTALEQGDSNNDEHETFHQR